MLSYAVVVFIACVSCMEMHETVERMVMVRTTGSDLQPAATGFIYKKESDGPASVIKMGESEVMKHLSNMYEQPKSFTAPIPIVVGPFYTKNDEDKSVEISSASKIIPVVEDQENKTDLIDGIADEDERKTLDEHASDFGHYKSNLEEYLKSLEGFDKMNQGEKDYYTHLNQQHGDSGTNGYVSNGQYSKADDVIMIDLDKADMFGDHYADGYDIQNDRPGYDQDKAVHGFHKYFDSDEYAKHQDYQNGEASKGIHRKISEGYADNESMADKFDERGLHGTGFHERAFERGHSYDKQSPEENSAEDTGEKGDKLSQQYLNEFKFESGKHDGGSYGYAIKH